MRRARETDYGRRGGTGPTAGKKATSYRVELPDGTVVTKRIFDKPASPAGYVYQHEGRWYVATVSEADDTKFNNCTRVPATEITK